MLALGMGFAVLFGSFSGPSPANANPRYAALVVDARNGEVLFSRHADAQRFPASLTKVMTLYVVFEELQAGNLRPDTVMRVSAHAQAQPPSELGLRSGQTITVRDAMLALVTKSANDAAAVIGEHISGSESAFARRMTQTARNIGMRSTVFRNASGLPNREQVTTARDMVLLGRAIQQRFPQRYSIFSTQRFTYRGRTYRNHNRLLGTVRGVDGIKTGYIRASGFNLLSSVQDRGRHIVAVVMGGRTGASRNAHMRDLIARHLPRATRGPRTALIAIRREPFNAPSPVPHPAALPVVATAFAPQPVQRPSAPTDAPVIPGVPGTVAAQLSPPLPRAEVASISPAASASAISTYEPARQAQQEPSGGSLQLGSVPDTGWTIQIGAVPSQEAAVGLLLQARSAVVQLDQRAPYTQTVQANGTTLWRARFGGFSERDMAQAACEALEAQSFACLAVRPDR
ncbi:MAG: D-alanyl-D-alanine carboxypeptidase [Devosiaceae bacterium]|nr:D-alanyl-D-alanine carboxypeptidase [Devosiaceae bacterium MH13]